MLLDFLREIERKRAEEEVLDAVEECKVVTHSVAEEHRKEVVPDVMASQTEVCGVCEAVQHKYKCPRCAILYCSIACFQRHNKGNCNEDFARDCVEEELKAQKSTMK